VIWALEANIVMSRINPSSKQRERLLNANADRCSVCKENNIGLQLHHIDGNNSNTVDANLAVLCTKDHDNHHRPQHYINNKNCQDLDSETLLNYKNSWEEFIKEARKDSPNIIATLNVFGSKEQIHSAKLVMQWVKNNNVRNNRIEYEKVFHLHTGGPDTWIDEILEEVNEIGENVQLVLIDEPLDIEYCPCCNGGSYSQTLDENIAIRYTAEDWDKESICTIYINPDQASLAFNIFYRNESIYNGLLHVCKNKYLHFSSESVDERKKIKKQPSVRRQATNLIQHILAGWDPSQIMIGTGNPDEPDLIEDFTLPIHWERLRKNL